jgi:hypothetical protein
MLSVLKSMMRTIPDGATPNKRLRGNEMPLVCQAVNQTKCEAADMAPRIGPGSAASNARSASLDSFPPIHYHQRLHPEKRVASCSEPASRHAAPLLENPEQVFHLSGESMATLLRDDIEPVAGAPDKFFAHTRREAENGAR